MRCLIRRISVSSRRWVSHPPMGLISIMPRRRSIAIQRKYTVRRGRGMARRMATGVLMAMGALCRSVDEPLEAVFEGRWESNELVWDRIGNTVSFEALLEVANENIKYELDCLFGLGPIERDILAPKEVAQRVGFAPLA